MRRDSLTIRQWLTLTLRMAPPEPLEFLFGWLFLVRGLWIALPWFSAWDVAPGLYRWYLAVAPDEGFWGAMDAFVGWLMLYGLFRDDRRARVWASRLVCGLFLCGSVQYFGAMWQSTAGVWNAAMFLAALWLWRRVGERAYEPGRE